MLEISKYKLSKPSHEKQENEFAIRSVKPSHEKQENEFAIRSVKNRPVHAQKMARGWKFRI